VILLWNFIEMKELLAWQIQLVRSSHSPSPVEMWEIQFNQSGTIKVSVAAKLSLFSPPPPPPNHGVLEEGPVSSRLLHGAQLMHRAL
jgi:hypothetical protein